MKRASAPSYDLFKTIVAVILVLILLLMLLRGCAVDKASPVPNVTETLVAAPVATETAPATEAAQTLTPSPPPATLEPATVEPTPTPTAAEPTTASPTATESPTAAPEQTTATPPAQNTSCNTTVPSRLSTGQKARVLQRLNMRKDASIRADILQVNGTGTQVEIIGGPVCTPVGDHAYLWWQIRLANGSEGWSAESPLNAATYFLEPVP